MNDTNNARGQAPRVGLNAIVAYAVLAMGLAWLAALPLWMGNGLATPGATLLLTVMMYTPAAAVLIVMLVMRPVPRGQRLRYLGMWPLRPARRVVWLSVIGLFAPMILIALAMLLSAALGWFQADFTGLSGFRRAIEASAPAGAALPPTEVLVLTQLIALPFAAATVNAIAAFGEEVGWRGFLLPALRQCGTWPALLISGAIWGLWHTPVILLGYNFGRTDVTGVLLMTAGCVVWGVLLGWLRLRSASLWPAVFAHGAMNATVGVPLLFAAADATFDPAWASGLGVSGWIVGGIVVVILLLAGQFRRQPALAAPRDASARAASAQPEA